MSIKPLVVGDQLKHRILQQGCYSQEENLRIFNKWFANGPRYVFQAVDKKYHLTNQLLCDVGCGYGVNLTYCKSGSYGIELENYSTKFARSIGLEVHQRTILKDDLSDLPRVDAIWCAAVLEHIDNLHGFLRQLHLLLESGGLLAVFVPTVPLMPRLRHLPRIGRYFDGHLHSDHINGFVPETLKFYCERAGFETIEVSPFYPSPLALINHIPLLKRLTDGCVYVGRKIGDWEYPENSTRRVANNLSGFKFIGQDFLS